MYNLLYCSTLEKHMRRTIDWEWGCELSCTYIAAHANIYLYNRLKKEMPYTYTTYAHDTIALRMAARQARECVSARTRVTRLRI
jgi:hypothetical protein